MFHMALYMNPKYARRQRFRRRVVVATAALVLLILSAGAVLRIDRGVRATMLPAAPPVAALEQEGVRQYTLTLFGRDYSFSTQWAADLRMELSALLRTPPASVRLAFQLRAALTQQLPRNWREDPRLSLGV